jgi:hypothetical protein
MGMPCIPGLGPSGRRPEAHPGYASLPRPQYVQLMDPETMVELLPARFTKYHSSLVSWSFLCPYLARDTENAQRIDNMFKKTILWFKPRFHLIRPPQRRL